MNKSYSMEKLNEINSKSFEERTNYIIEDLINPKTNYFKESTDENILSARNFKSYVHARGDGKITGYALKVSHIENLACLNIYRNNKKKLSKEELKKSSDELFELISKFNFSHVVKTDSGGAMIYCNVNNFEMKEQEKFCNLAKNQNSKYKCELYVYNKNLAEHKNNYVLLYGSQVKHDNSDEILKFELVIGDPKKPVEPSLEYVLKCFEIENV